MKPISLFRCKYRFFRLIDNIKSYYRFSTSCKLFKEESDLGEYIPENIETECLTTKSLRLAGMPHQVYIIQPYIKWGRKKIQNTTPQLQLEESIALVETLPDWKVVGTRIVSLTSFEKQYFFNTGNLEILTDLIRSQKEITAVFLNVNSLRLHQHLHLEEAFKVPVFDRYGLIINIFKKHAKTKEAKLQVSLAEIPYFWSRVQGIQENEESFTENVGIGSNETFKEKRLRILTEREMKIKKEISILANQRELLRKKRKGMQFPTVAIVGYTNAGKTSLIKSLTESKTLMPEDKLFATLDVTVHAGWLPSNMKVLYVDTIGFISDVPSQLLEPFVATLEDALMADVVVHVQDVSHPDVKAQSERVLQTLKELNLPEDVANNIITVKNKCDKIEDLKPNEDGDNELVIYTSCKNGIGFAELKVVIERVLLKTTNLMKIKIRVKSGSEEYRWLYKESSVSDVVTDNKDLQFVYLVITISKAKLEKFKHQFIK